jgi:hypothetical protein
MNIKDRWYYFTYFLVTFVLSIYQLPGLALPGHDKQVFVYAGMALWKGDMPYRDFFDHKPPVIFFISALAWPLKETGYFLLAFLAKCIAAVCIHRTAVIMGLKNVFVYPILFLVFILTPSILVEGTLTREYAACFLAILLMHIFTVRGSAYFKSGLLSALVFHTQQEELFWAMPLLVWQLFQAKEMSEKNWWKPLFANAVQILSGFLILSMPILLWAIYRNTLYGYWHVTLTYNLFVYGNDKTAWGRISALTKVLYYTRFLYFIVPLMLLHLFYAFRKTNTLLHTCMIIAFLAGCTVKVIFGRITDIGGVYHYTLPLSALIVFSLAVVMGEIKFNFAYRWQLAVNILLVLFSFFLFWKNSTKLLAGRFKQKHPTELEALTGELVHMKNKDRQLYVMGYTPFLYLNTRLHCLSPSPWIYMSPFRQELNFDKDATVITDITHSLDKYQTTYVVDFLLKKPFKQKLHQQIWVAYLAANYTKVKESEKYILFKRNNK